MEGDLLVLLRARLGSILPWFKHRLSMVSMAACDHVEECFVRCALLLSVFS